MDTLPNAAEIRAATQSNDITGPFGSVVNAPQPAVPEPGVQAQATAARDGARIPVTDETVKADQGFAQARAARDARAARADASVLETIGAGISTWDSTRLLKRIARPSFAGDTAIDQFEYLQNLPMVLSEDERDYFMDVGKGVESAQYAVDQIMAIRQAHDVVGDSPVVGLATAFVDPLWLVVPPAVRLGKAVPAAAGRAVSGAAAGSFGAAVTALGEGPVSDQEIAMSMVMNAAVGTLFYRSGKLTKQADPDYPEQAINNAIEAAERGMSAVDTAPVQNSKAAGLGSKLMWNMHKTMSAFGDVGKRVANMLYDNNADLSLTSVEAEREAIMSRLRTSQFKYEDALRDAMRERGYGTLGMIFKSREAYAVQSAIEKEVQRELFRREQFTRQGIPLDSTAVPPHIAKMADHLDEMHRAALAEMKAAGVEGIENITERAGYLNRRWNSAAVENILAELERRGVAPKKAKAHVVGVVSLALRRGSGIDAKLADQIGSAIVDRTLRKGYFEDDLAGEMRDILSRDGMSTEGVEQALAALRAVNDEAGKAGYLKHRMDLDYKATANVAGLQINVTDLIDSRVSTIADLYVKRVSTNAALARKGIKSASDVEKLREELLRSTPKEQRANAQRLFDNTMAHFRGDPAGARLNENFRLMQVYGRSTALAWSALWQLTEYATAMAEFGAAKTLKYAIQEIPGFKSIMSPDMETARTLNNVLAQHSVESMRLRPFLATFEDGFELDTASALQLSAQTIGQLVPYANGMRYVHHNQARVVGNLILDRVRMAAEGNVKAREALQRYGLGLHVMDRLASEIKSKGFDVDAWDGAVWDAVRPAFAKMMDASVLRGRLGDVPEFAAFDPVGKLLFTYRTFVLTAHNKVLAGMLERTGAGAVGLVMLYQLPLALAAVQAQAVLNGGGTLSQEDMIKKALGQMGGLGLFSEPLKWAAGESNSVGAPVLRPIDQGVKLFQAGTNLDARTGASTALTMLPVVSAVPFIRGMANNIKE